MDQKNDSKPRKTSAPADTDKRKAVAEKPAAPEKTYQFRDWASI